MSMVRTERVYGDMKLLHGLLIVAAAIGLSAGAAQGGSNQIGEASRAWPSSSRMVVHRAANFGNHENFSLFIDGRHVATLGYNRSYDAVLPAGDHLVMIKQMPHLNDAYPVHYQWIRLSPGRTAVFTAIWRNGGTSAVLEES